MVIALSLMTIPAGACDPTGAYPEMRHVTVDLAICFASQPRRLHDEAGLIDRMIAACRAEMTAWERRCKAVIPNVDCTDLAAQQLWEAIRP